MALLLQRVGLGVGPAVDGDARRPAPRSAWPLAGDALTSPIDGDAAAGGELLDFGLVVGQLAVGDDLHVAVAGAVVELEKAEAALGIAAGADPALHLDLLADRRLAASVGDRESCHEGILNSPLKKGSDPQHQGNEVCKSIVLSAATQRQRPLLGIGRGKQLFSFPRPKRQV